MYDISRAHLHEVQLRRVFCGSPDEDNERLAVGFLGKCMCGTVDASVRWQGHHAQILKEHSFVQGISNSSLFVHVERYVRLLVHCDDFMVEVPTHEQKVFESVLFSQHDGRCTAKVHSDWNAAMEASFLNRVIWWVPTSGMAELEADTMHFAIVLRDLGLEKSTPLVAKRPKSEELPLLAGEKPLNADDTTLYRSLTMRVNCLSPDCLDLSFAAGSLARGMKSPTTKDLEEFKHVGDLGAAYPILELQFCGDHI